MIMKKTITLFLLISSFTALSQTAQQHNKLKYKSTDEKTNEHAKKVLSKELTKDSTTYALFDKILYIGPNLWKRYNSIESLKKIEGGNVQFRVRSNNATTTLPGKLIQSKSDFKTIWSHLLKEINSSKLAFRKLNKDELEYYWAVIFYDIEEPVFIVEAGKFKYLIQLIKNNFKIK